MHSNGPLPPSLNNISMSVLTSHWDVAVVVHIAAVEAAKAVTIADAASGSLSATASTSSSHSVSP